MADDDAQKAGGDSDARKRLERMLELRFQFENAPEDIKERARDLYESALGQAVAGTNFSRSQLDEALAHRYRDYRRRKLLDERNRLSY